MWQGCICFMLMFMSMNAGPTDKEAIDSAQIQEILRQDRGGVLRGVHFNMPKEAVSTLEENTRCLKIENGRMTYAIKESSSAFPEHIKVHYDFETEGLSEITVESVQKDYESAISLYRNLKDHFNKTYGDGKLSRNGITSWTGTDKETGVSFDIVCELQDFSVIIEYYSI